MLTDDESVYISAIYAELLTEQKFQAGGIQHGACADDAFRGKAGDTQCNAGQQINRIGDNQEDRIRTDARDLCDDRAHDSGVACQQVKTALAGPLSDARSDDDHGGVLQVIIIAVHDAARLRK